VYMYSPIGINSSGSMHNVKIQSSCNMNTCTSAWILAILSTYMSCKIGHRTTVTTITSNIDCILFRTSIALGILRGCMRWCWQLHGLRAMPANLAVNAVIHITYPSIILTFWFRNHLPVTPNIPWGLKFPLVICLCNVFRGSVMC
jgi:hypothetical protein